MVTEETSSTVDEACFNDRLLASNLRDTQNNLISYRVSAVLLPTSVFMTARHRCPGEGHVKMVLQDSFFLRNLISGGKHMSYNRGIKTPSNASLKINTFCTMQASNRL